MENKIIGDVNIITSGGQFKEQGSIHIVEPPASAEFNAVFMDVGLKYAHFSDFSNAYPYLINTSLSQLEVPDNTPTVLFDNFRLRSFDNTEDGNIDSNTWNGIVSRYLPWIHAVDTSGDRTHSLEIRLSRKNPDYTPAGWISPPDDYGFRDVQDWSGGSDPGPTDNTLYKLEIRSANDIIVKAFALIYDMEVVKP